MSKGEPTTADLPAASGIRRGPIGNAAYWISRIGSLILLKLLYRMRSTGADRAPLTGSILVIANHQSHLDAPAIGDTLARTDLTFVARRGLFKNSAFAWLLRNLNTIPIDEDRGDMGAIRGALAGLKEGRAIMVFPEGSRSYDGTMQPFKRGAWLLMSRAKCPVLPVAVEGAFDAFPRGRSLPRLFGQRLSIAVGEPIAYERLREMGPEQGLAYLATLVDQMRLELRRDLRSRSGGRYPAPGPADHAFRLGAMPIAVAKVPGIGAG